MIHMFNKNENAIHSSPYFETLSGRTNVILLGDSLGDIHMAKGVPSPNNVLKIGFLNEKVGECRKMFFWIINNSEMCCGHTEGGREVWWFFFFFFEGLYFQENFIWKTSILILKREFWWIGIIEVCFVMWKDTVTLG